VLDGGGGRDRVAYFLARHDVRANLSTHRASGEGLDTLVHVEDLEGSPYDDVLVGDARGNDIDGGNGSDALLGSDGGDRLLGGRGDDRLRGGAGADVLDDSLRVAQGVFPDTGADLLSGGPGDDRPARARPGPSERRAAWGSGRRCLLGRSRRSVLGLPSLGP
jgi:Ca2+-binding RTX toxin-like protein